MKKIKSMDEPKDIYEAVGTTQEREEVKYEEKQRKGDGTGLQEKKEPVPFLKKLLMCQIEIGAIAKTQDNPFFHSKYADINAILAVVKPILNKHDLVLTQEIDVVEGRNGLNTVIWDVSSDTRMDSHIFLPEKVSQITKEGIVYELLLDPQKMGSAITYYRRYAIQSLLALETQDDDGNSISPGVKYNKKGIVESVDTNEDPFNM